MYVQNFAIVITASDLDFSAMYWQIIITTDKEISAINSVSFLGTEKR